jgi:DNA mismatch endonuclease (patch repair protein)
MERKLKDQLDQGKFKNVSKERSRTMAAIRAKHTRTTEWRLRMALVRQGIKGWTLHVDELPGKPDLYFARKRLAVFVDGCFWHGCPSCGHIPKTRSKFWEEKIRLNQKRDRRNKSDLQQLGISIIRIWEHELINKQRLAKTIEKLRGNIRSWKPRESLL